MAGEMSAIGIKIYYAPETSVGVRPSSGYAEKASGASLKLAEYITGTSAMEAEYDTHDVTTLSETSRHRFVKGLQNNDGKVECNCNVNPTSRESWNAICDEHAALTGGKSFWWEVVLPGDDMGYFFRGEPTQMEIPALKAGDSITGSVKIIESGNDGWQTKATA